MVLLLIVTLGWWVKRFGRYASAGRHLRVVAGLALGPRERIVLIQVGETQLLLGVTSEHVETLYVLPHPIEEEDKASQGSQTSVFSIPYPFGPSKH